MQEVKMSGESLNIEQENISKLKEIFPEVFNEDKIDFDILGNYIDTDEEKYRFTWNGKMNALRLSQTPSVGTLRPCKEESRDWDATQNLYIEGDNLEVLKLLQNSYLNKIKMIYIDPPYNTGHDFVYSDDFKDSIDNYKKVTGQIDSEGNATSTNKDSDGRYHTNWLNMMYPRLRLAKNLLTDNGIIFISINDKEFENLQKICNEIFGETNFIANLIWDKNVSAQAGIYKVYHEYILVYCKNIDEMEVPTSLNNDEFSAAAIKKISGRHPATQFTFPKGTRFDAPDGTIYEGEFGDTIKVKIIKGKMIAQDGKLAEDVTIEAGFTQANQMKEYFYGNRENLFDTQGQKISEFWFNSTGKIQITKVRSVESPQTTCKFGTQASATKELQELFQLQESPFSAPKPIAMVYDFIQRFTGKNDIILDFFSGSATTAHSLFKADFDKQLNRSFILVQLQENLEESLKTAQKDAVNTLKSGIAFLQSIKKPLVITELGKERIRLAGNKIKVDIDSQNKQLKLGEELRQVPDIGFKVFKLDSSNIRKWNPDTKNIEQSLLDQINNFVDGRTEEDALYEIILKNGLPLTVPVEELDIKGKKVYSIGMGALIVCLDNNITLEVADEIANINTEFEDKSQVTVVFKDNGFANDSVKTNIKETIRGYGIGKFVTV